MTIPTFSPLTDKERAWIEQQLGEARRFIATTSATDADRSMNLESLDRAFAVWLPECGNDMAKVNAVINAVGIQFGQFLVDAAGFEWTIATDAQGTDLAVRALPNQADMLVYPANFVAKRWARGESGFLAPSFQDICKNVEAVAAQWAGQQRRP